jgi:WD40 repeat protein
MTNHRHTIGEASRPAPPGPYAVLRGHLAPVNSISFLPHSDRYLTSGGADGTIKVWDLSIRRATLSVHAHSKAGVLHVSSINNAILSHGRDGYISLWDVSQGSLQAQSKIRCGSYTFTKAHPMDPHCILTPTEHAEMVRILCRNFTCYWSPLFFEMISQNYSLRRLPCLIYVRRQPRRA